jgi:hypothetical protein
LVDGKLMGHAATINKSLVTAFKALKDLVKPMIVEQGSTGPSFDFASGTTQPASVTQYAVDGIFIGGGMKKRGRDAEVASEQILIRAAQLNVVKAHGIIIDHQGTRWRVSKIITEHEFFCIAEVTL